MKHLVFSWPVILVLTVQIFLSLHYLRTLTEARFINNHHNPGVSQNPEKTGNTDTIFPQRGELAKDDGGDDDGDKYFEDIEGDESLQKSDTARTEKHNLIETNEPIIVTKQMRGKHVEVPTDRKQKTEVGTSFKKTRQMTFKTQDSSFEDDVDTTSFYSKTQYFTETTETSTNGRLSYGLPTSDFRTTNGISPNPEIETDNMRTSSTPYYPVTTDRNAEASTPTFPTTILQTFQSTSNIVPALQDNLSATDVIPDFSNKSESDHKYYNGKNDNSSNAVKMNFNIPDIPDVKFNLKIERKAVNNKTFQNNARGFRRYIKAKHKRRNANYKKVKHARRLVKRFRSPYKIHNTMKNKRHTRSLSEDFKNISLRHRSLRKHHPTTPMPFSNTEKDSVFKVIKPHSLTVVKIAPNIRKPTLFNYGTEDAPHALNSNKGLQSKYRALNDEQTDFDTTDNYLDTTSSTQIKNENDNKSTTIASNVWHKFTVKDSQNLFEFKNSNSSDQESDSYTKRDAEKAIYMLNFPISENGSFPNDTEIIKLLKRSKLQDNVHYVEERGLGSRKEMHQCCQDFFSVVKQNPLLVALVLAVCCMIMVVLLIGVFFMAERRFKYQQLPNVSRENPPGYKVPKNKEGAAVNRISRASTELPRKENSDDEPESFRRKTNAKSFNIPKNGRGRNSTKEFSKENKYNERKVPENKEGLMQKAQSFIRRMSKRICNKPATNSSSDGNDMDSRKSQTDDNTSSSETDKTYVSKRQRLKRFVKTRGGRRKVPAKTTPKIIAPDIRSKIREIKMYMSEDTKSIGSLPATSTRLKEKIITTGDCEQIDNMLTRGEWSKACYATHGLGKITDDQEWLDHIPEERRKMNLDKIEAASAVSLGVLSKGSSTVALKSAVVRSINTAEWVNKHPRPVSNTRLKGR